MPRALPLAIAVAALALTARGATSPIVRGVTLGGSDPAIVLVGTGVQIYGCAASNGAYAWRLKAPDAVLTDSAGHRVGRHFAGPSWQADDGSTVVGEPLVASPAPRPGAIPWLVLRAKSHSGTGVFAGVSYIVRSMTTGGVAPAGGCDAAHADAEARVDYTATYTFFPG
ncbi:hypothetical protein tb265_11670 [Gemmatimonadetes bacterium T265]|nr:hypothetical protein tb265_11670 [Gemmatimonadetes bacterium T265]